MVAIDIRIKNINLTLTDGLLRKSVLISASLTKVLIQNLL